MTPTARPDDPASLVDHVDGLRALARGLLGDAHLAEDVVQDAMVAAIRRPLAADIPLGPWLVGVVRNLARFSRRGQSRRTARERATVARAAEETAEAVVARAEIHRGLVDALLRLPEPYRATLLHRYFDGEEPTEIARRLGVPAETVRTRVRRGLALLREALRADRDDDAWMLALLPLVRERDAAPTAGATLATGVIVMTMKTKAVAALVVLALVAAAFYALPGSSTSTDRDVAKSNAAATPETRDARRTRGSNASPVDASKNADAASSSTDEQAGDPAKWPIRVTTNVPGAKVSLQLRLYGFGSDPVPETKTSDAKGFVGFAAPAKDVTVARFDLVARAEGWATTRAKTEEPSDVRIDLTPAVAVRGVVRDSAGRPVANASFDILSDVKWCGDEPGTDAEGAFEAFVEKSGPVSFQVQHTAFLPRSVTVDAPAKDLVVVLDRGLEVSGRVAFSDGRAVPGAAILDGDGRTRATADELGRYVVSGVARGPITLKCDVDGTRTAEAGATDVDFTVTRPVARVRFVDAKGRSIRFVGLHFRVHKDGVDLRSMASSGGVEEPDEMVLGESGAKLLVSGWTAHGQKGSASITFDDKPRVHDVDVVVGAVRPAGAIRLIVRCDTPEIPRAVYVDVENETGQTVARGARERFDLDAAGAGDIPNVPSGHVVVVVAATAHWSAESLETLWVTARPGAEVEVGRTTEVVATLVSGGRVRATVRDEDGKPVAPADVRLSTSSDGQFLDSFVRRTEGGGWTTKLDTSPSVLLDAVKPGRYDVQTKGPSGDEVTKEVEVVRGETADVVLTVKAKR